MKSLVESGQRKRAIIPIIGSYELQFQIILSQLFLFQSSPRESLAESEQ